MAKVNLVPEVGIPNLEVKGVLSCFTLCVAQFNHMAGLKMAGGGYPMIALCIVQHKIYCPSYHS